jgi:hypothetical protein
MALRDGQRLGEGIDLAGENLDLPGILGLLIAGRAITGVHE